MTTNPRNKKPATQKNTNNGNHKPTNKSTPWGRAASPHRPGLFTKQYLVKYGQACAADVFRAMDDEIVKLNQERIEIGEKPLRRPNYSSFSRYFHWFLILGLIERTGKREPAIYSFLKNRVFYRLTNKGKSEKKAWADPVAATHPKFRSQPDR
jgi:hypothetical protein